MYDSILGRFISRDPVGYLVSMNLYEYVLDRPTSATDPIGMDFTPEDFTRGIIRRRIVQLDDSSFQVRQQATQDLEKLIAAKDTRELTKQELRKALETRPALEHRLRIERILEPVEREELRQKVAGLIKGLDAKTLEGRIDAENNLLDLLKALKRDRQITKADEVKQSIRDAVRREVEKRDANCPYSPEIIRRGLAVLKNDAVVDP